MAVERSRRGLYLRRIARRSFSSFRCRGAVFEVRSRRRVYLCGFIRYYCWCTCTGALCAAHSNGAPYFHRLASRGFGPHQCKNDATAAAISGIKRYCHRTYFVTKRSAVSVVISFFDDADGRRQLHSRKNETLSNLPMQVF